MDDTKYAIVIDNCTQWCRYLVKYELTREGYEIHEYHDVPTRVMLTDFCDNIFLRPQDIKSNWEISINGMRGYYGWHIGPKDFERVRELIKTLKAVEIFEKLSKYQGA